MLNKLDNALSFHQNALRVRAQRQELIAANIANADTPQFKARDIDFNAAMQQALSGVTSQSSNVAGNGSLVKTNVLHMSGGAPNSSLNINAFVNLGAGSNQGAGANIGVLVSPNALGVEPQYRQIAQGNVDANTVDMDVERNQFVDNAVRYEASLTMLNGQLKKILAAIQGQ